MKRYSISGLIALLLTGCSVNDSTPDELTEQTVSSFATAYFNLDYQEAKSYTTPESEKWLRYAASNVTQADIDLFNKQEKPAEVSIEDLLWQNDSTAIVTIIVNNFVCSDSISGTPKIASNEWFELTLVNRNGLSLVKMEGPLRSEKQNHD